MGRERRKDKNDATPAGKKTTEVKIVPNGIPYLHRPPEGEPLKWKDPKTGEAHLICGAKLRTKTLPGGKPCACPYGKEKFHKLNKGRCPMHGGGRRGRRSGRPPSPETIAEEAVKAADELTRKDLIKRWLGAAADMAISVELLSGLDDIEIFERRKMALELQLALGNPLTDWKHAHELFETVKNSGGSPDGVSAMKELGDLLKHGAGREGFEEKHTALTMQQNRLRETEHKRLANAEEMLSKRVANAMLVASHMQALKVLDEVFGPILARYGVKPEEYRRVRETYVATVGGFLLGEPRAGLPQRGAPVPAS